MKQNRRDFLKSAGYSGLILAGGGERSGSSAFGKTDPLPDNVKTNIVPGKLNLIGPYGDWAAKRVEGIPSLSFRKEEFTSSQTWQPEARKRTIERLAIPEIGSIPEVRVEKQYSYDGLHIEELTWQLPYGRPTKAILLKPQNIKTQLPGILAFHDHGGQKYFGADKITRTGSEQHSVMQAHQAHYYEGTAWANEVAKRGYVVLVSDAFPFASRRVMLSDVPEQLRSGLRDEQDPTPEQIDGYNEWAAAHEHIMAKSLFSSGTTWPGVFFAEDQKALDILCARKEVDASRIGCAGLSGGGMRTVFMGGLDPRIKCAVCVGFMTTWKDFILNKSFTHTWMTYVPLLPNELDFPEILGLRVPLPTLVQNDEDDNLYTLPEMRRADTILREVYRKAKAEEKYKCSFYPGPHKFDRAMQAEAFDWFDQWLN